MPSLNIFYPAMVIDSLLATRTCHHEQESCTGRSDPISFRAARVAREQAHPPSSPIPDAPMPLRVPIEYVLRGYPPEWRYRP